MRWTTSASNDIVRWQKIQLLQIRSKNRSGGIAMQQTKRRGLVTVVATLAVLAAACSTSSSPKSSGSSPSPSAGGGTTIAKLTASAKGVTADTIKLAFTYPDLE